MKPNLEEGGIDLEGGSDLSLLRRAVNQLAQLHGLDMWFRAELEDTYKAYIERESSSRPVAADMTTHFDDDRAIAISLMALTHLAHFSSDALEAEAARQTIDEFYQAAEKHGLSFPKFEIDN